MKSVKEMTAQSVALGQSWMVEIVGRIAGHAEPLHDSNRPYICRRRERNDFGQAYSTESVGECRPCGLCCETSTPISTVEPPADFNSGREMSLEVRHRQTDEAYEWSFVRRFNRPEPITELIELSLNQFHHRIGFVSAHYTWKLLHNDGIGVEFGERLAIDLPPSP